MKVAEWLRGLTHGKARPKVLPFIGNRCVVCFTASSIIAQLRKFELKPTRASLEELGVVLSPPSKVNFALLWA